MIERNNRNTIKHGKEEGVSVGSWSGVGGVSQNRSWSQNVTEIHSKCCKIIKQDHEM
jgi:hypothetical protein